jgi:inhibitor of KinA sporulation pathway (predicted exonuclease)
MITTNSFHKVIHDLNNGIRLIKKMFSTSVNFDKSVKKELLKNRKFILN